MNVTHAHARPTLPVVSQQKSTSTPTDPSTELDRNLLPDMRKTLPSQANGAANGLSVQKIFDQLDTNGDGKITAAEAGPRFGHGVLGQLLALQAQPAPTGDPTPSADGPATGDEALPPVA
jgi:hypothetical protein